MPSPVDLAAAELGQGVHSPISEASRLRSARSARSVAAQAARSTCDSMQRRRMPSATDLVMSTPDGS